MFLISLGWAIAATVCFRFDSAWSAALTSADLPGDLRKAINLSEVFAHGFGVAAILGSVLLLTPQRRPLVWTAILVTLVSGLVANGLKNCFVRVRPNARASIRVVEQGKDPISAWAVLGGEQIEIVQPSFWDSRQRSFPSGHTATAWGLAIGLGLVFPRGTWLFAVFASLASLQRITSGAHYPSDVLAGAAIAFACAAIVFSLPKFRDVAAR